MLNNTEIIHCHYRYISFTWRQRCFFFNLFLIYQTEKQETFTPNKSTLCKKVSAQHSPLLANTTRELGNLQSTFREQPSDLSRCSVLEQRPILQSRYLAYRDWRATRAKYSPITKQQQCSCTSDSNAMLSQHCSGLFLFSKQRIWYIATFI